MVVIRRIYLYAVSLVSLETVLWGVIGLVRSVFHPGQAGTDTARLAGALSLILVGIPVFLVHWRLAQRFAFQDPVERFSRTRAVFLYVTLIVTLFPVTFNLLALLDRLFLELFNQRAAQTMIAGGQTFSDYLIAVIFNSLAAVFFLWVLDKDWRASPTNDNLSEVRRLYRYIWLLYALILAVAGLQQLVKFLLDLTQVKVIEPRITLAHSLALLLAGIPLWVYHERLLRRSLVEPAEATSLLRLLVLYVLVFTSLVILLICSGLILSAAISLLLGANWPWRQILAQISAPLSFALPMAMVWLIYRQSLHRTGQALFDQPLRQALQRLYDYLLGFLGLAAAFAGLLLALDALLDWAFNFYGLNLSTQDMVYRTRFAENTAMFLVGLPVWLVVWRRIQKEATGGGEAGDRARRSLIRKTALYAALFAGVIGLMFSTGSLLYQFLRLVLGDPAEFFTLEVLRWSKTLLLYALLAGYFWRVIRVDVRLAEHSLTQRHAQFPVLVLAYDESGEAGFTDALVAGIERQVPGLPVSIHPASRGAPDESLSTAQAVIVPSALLTQIPAPLSQWLKSFSGARLLVPMPAHGWFWPGGSRTSSGVIREVAQTLRHLAEGDAPTEPRLSSAFQILVYVLAGLFTLEVLLVVVSIFASLLLER